jgi:UPF0176 protein
MNLHILYSFRRCPYAIRARMALAMAHIPCELHEVSLRDKPAELLRASPKGTVPVLVQPDGKVIDQSLEIMQWALQQNDPALWLKPTEGVLADLLLWVQSCDSTFKQALDRYKYPSRHPQDLPLSARNDASAWLVTVNQQLSVSGHLQGIRDSLADVAIFPFVRQFAAVDPLWWTNQPWLHLHAWLQRWLESALFNQVMRKDGADIASTGWDMTAPETNADSVAAEQRP